MCFVHVLLNSLDLDEKGLGGKIILEGDAVTLVDKMINPENPLNKLYMKAKEKNLFIGACRACSAKLKVTDTMTAEGIPLIGDMMGHPAMSEYIEQGYQILTF
jgi:hypothetical protein